MSIVARRLARSWLLVATSVLGYASVQALSPALHHDEQCHAQHPGHCDACRVGAPAPGAATPLLAARPLPVSGGAVPVRAQRPPDSFERGRESGRAPPALL